MLDLSRKRVVLESSAEVMDMEGDCGTRPDPRVLKGLTVSLENEALRDTRRLIGFLKNDKEPAGRCEVRFTFVSLVPTPGGRDTEDGGTSSFPVELCALT